MENEKLKFVKLFLPKKKKRSMARAVISLVFFPFKLESLKKSLTEQRTLKLLLKPGNKKRVLKLHTNILQ